MQFKIIETENRNYICDENCSETDKTSSCNLMIGEKKIMSLIAENCPDSTLCIQIENGVSSICRKLGPYPDIYGSILGEKIRCRHETQKKKVERLDADSCPVNKPNCIECKNLKHIIVDATHKQKSHSHIVCDYDH